jgi:hypothetical protein
LGNTASIGVGYRRLSAHEHAYIGVNAFYDHAFSGGYHRISAGVEYVNGFNTVYANAYKGLSQGGLVKGRGGTAPPARLYPEGLPPRAADGNYYGIIPGENYTTYTLDKALGGYDIAYVRDFKNARWARAYVNGYYWRGGSFNHEQEYRYGRPGHWTVPLFLSRKNTHYKGLKVGAELQLTPHISLDIGYNSGNHASKGMYGVVKYTLGASRFAYWGGKHSDDIITTARAKMLDKVRRQDMVVESMYDIEYFYLAPIDHL